MRAISFQQPWAHLVSCGVKQVEIRTWPPKQRTGRIAIHASFNFALKETMRAWESNSDVARCFAEQGWIGEDDLKALPRSAILGTVELKGVHRAAAVRAAKVDFGAKDWITDALEHAVRDRETGRLRAAQAALTPLPVTIPAEGWVWAFAKALEVEPILGVPGQQHLWECSAEVVAELAAREQRRRLDEWSPPPVPREARRASVEAWRLKWETSLAREAWELEKDAVRELMNRTMTLDDPKVENLLRRELRNYMKEHSVGTGRHVQVRIARRLRSLFGGRELVPALDFELELRRLIHETTEMDKVEREGWERHAAIVEFLTELRARVEKGEVKEAAVAEQVKGEFKRLLLKQMKEEETMERLVRFPEYD